EGLPLEVHVVLALQVGACFEDHALDALLGELVGEGAASGAGADDDDGLGGMVDGAHAVAPLLPLLFCVRPVRPARALLCPAGTAAPRVLAVVAARGMSETTSSSGSPS